MRMQSFRHRQVMSISGYTGIGVGRAMNIAAKKGIGSGITGIKTSTAGGVSTRVTGVPTEMMGQLLARCSRFSEYRVTCLTFRLSCYSQIAGRD
jgi:hypothetical protein